MKNNAVIMFSNIPWQWSADYLRQSACEVAHTNDVYCLLTREAITFRQLIKKQHPLIIERPFPHIILYRFTDWLPFTHRTWIKSGNFKLNIFILKCIILLNSGYKPRLLWFFYPDIWGITKHFTKVPIIYDCLDYHIGNEKGRAKTKLKALENQLIKKADIVVANSQVLFQHCQQIRSDITIVPQGFSSTLRLNQQANLSNFKHPVIGFVGGINERLDYDLLLTLIKKHPEWTFVLWGPKQGCNGNISKETQLTELLTLPNVISGESNRSELGRILSQFDIAMIPYDLTLDFNKYSYPMKIFEYFYLGLPIVSVPIVELMYPQFQEFIKLGKDASSWEKLIQQLLTSPLSRDLIVKEKQLATDNSWYKKIEKIYSELKKINY